MKRFHRRIAVLASLLVAVPLFAAKFWESKPYTEWTDKECLEMLTKSPWTFSSAFGSTISVKDSIPTLDSADKAPTFGEREVTYAFDFRFLSATPIRMAMARMRLLQKPGDAALQAELGRFVQSTPEKIIAVEFSYRAIPPGDSGLHDIASFFSHATFADFSR